MKKNSFTLYIFLIFGLTFLLIGIFGPRGYFSNKRTEANIENIEEQIVQHYGNKALEYIAQSLNENETAKRKEGLQTASSDEFLSDKSVIYRLITALGLASCIFFLFIFVKKKIKQNDESNNPFESNGNYDSDNSENNSIQSPECPILNLDNKKDLEKFVNIIENNGIVIMPCDTIYGICSKVNEDNKYKIQQIKQRDLTKELIILATKDETKRIFGDNCPKGVYNMWPCALSVIAKSTDGNKCVRVPNDKVLNKILDKVNQIYSTSVNISGYTEINDLDSIIKQFSKSVNAIGYIKNKKFTQSSTILDATVYPFKVIREGEIKEDYIRKNLY